MFSFFSNVILRYGAYLSFIADIFAIFQFIRELLHTGAPLPIQRTISFFSIILFAFLFGLLLLYLSEIKRKQSRQLFLLFAMVYAILASLLLGITSFIVGSGSIDEIYEVLYFCIAIIIASAFAYFMGLLSRENKGILCVPYVVATIIHIVYIIYQIYSRNIGIPVYNITILILGGALVFLFSWRARKIL